MIDSRIFDLERQIADFAGHADQHRHYAHDRIPPHLNYWFAASTADLTLTTSYQDVVGATVTIPKPGIYLVFTGAQLGGTASAAPGMLRCQVVAGGTAQTGQATSRVPASLLTIGTFLGVNVVTVITGNNIFKLQAKKDSDEGTYYAYSPLTAITVVQVG